MGWDGRFLFPVNIFFLTEIKKLISDGTCQRLAPVKTLEAAFFLDENHGNTILHNCRSGVFREHVFLG